MLTQSSLKDAKKNDQVITAGSILLIGLPVRAIVPVASSNVLFFNHRLSLEGYRVSDAKQHTSNKPWVMHIMFKF